MIKLKRERSKEAIPSGLRGAPRVEKNLDVLKLKKQKRVIPSKDFKSSRWKPAKRQLREETNDKCAYCEADTKVVAHGDVEHFRPKNVYWWLAYCYDNYLYSCQICNQTFKSNRFPISGPKLRGPVVRSNSSEARLKRLANEMTHDPLDLDGVEEFEDATWNEDADLIDPYLEDPADLLVYDVDDVAEEILIKIAPRSHNRTARQKAIDTVYGLNREELKRLRYMDYKLLRAFRKVFENEELADLGETQLREMIADDHRFAGMCRYFVKRKWKLEFD